MMLVSLKVTAIGAYYYKTYMVYLTQAPGPGPRGARALTRPTSSPPVTGCNALRSSDCRRSHPAHPPLHGTLYPNLRGHRVRHAHGRLRGALGVQPTIAQLVHQLPAQSIERVVERLLLRVA